MNSLAAAARFQADVVRLTALGAEAATLERSLREAALGEDPGAPAVEQATERLLRYHAELVAQRGALTHWIWCELCRSDPALPAPSCPVCGRMCVDDAFASTLYSDYRRLLRTCPRDTLVADEAAGWTVREAGAVASVCREETTFEIRATVPRAPAGLRAIAVVELQGEPGRAGAAVSADPAGGILASVLVPGPPVGGLRWLCLVTGHGLDCAYARVPLVVGGG